MRSVKHVVLSGGGLKGIAFLGALECLQRSGILRVSDVETFAGSSAGALISALLVIGHTVAEIFKCVHDIDVSDITEPDLTLIVSEYGVESGRRIMSTLAGHFIAKGIDSGVTFGELHRRTGKRLVVTTSCLGKGVRYFDHVSDPDMCVLLALRMSIAIPLVFTAVHYQGDYYVDGGLLDNVPIAALKGCPQHEVLTIRTGSHDDSHPSPMNLTRFVSLLIKSVTKEMEDLRRRHRHYRDHHEASVVIDAGEHKISVTNEEKKTLFGIGYRAAKAYLASDRYLTAQINALPYNAMRLIWYHKHKLVFQCVLKELCGKVLPISAISSSD